MNGQVCLCVFKDRALFLASNEKNDGFSRLHHIKGYGHPVGMVPRDRTVCCIDSDGIKRRII